MKKEFLIYGNVQGVGFRYFTWREAVKIGICGYVKNMSNGSVYVVACGTMEQIEKFQAYLQKGPKSATVATVIMQDYIGQQAFSDFSIKY